MDAPTTAGRRYLYFSHAVRPLGDAELVALADVCRRRNEALGITGFLLHLNGRFAQVIEGPAAAIATLVGLIARDPRHRDIVVLHDGPMTARLFDGWSMATPAAVSPDAARDFTAQVRQRLAAPPGDPGSGEVAEMLARFWREFAG